MPRSNQRIGRWPRLQKGQMLSLDLYPDDQLAVRWSPVSTRLFSQLSRSEERGAIRFLFSVAFPPLPVTIRQRSSTFVERLCSLRRVLASGSHSFLSEWLEKVSQPSLAKPFGSDKGVNRINSRLSLLSLGRHRTDCRSLFGLEGRNPRDAKQYIRGQEGLSSEIH